MDRFADPLPDGTTLLKGQYTIKKFLNDGGFGITYLATDSLDRPMVIKECFPRAICRRDLLDVGTRAISHREEFRSIVKAFVEEARNLSKFEHPNIVKVHQVFDENQTAYMAMDYVDGHELVATIIQNTLDPERITTIAMKLLDALATIHENGMLHRDISPDNILLDHSGNPVLIDFGAAKEEAAQHGPKMTSIRVTKDGYSPQEFYVSGAQQFPSSDLYALAATLYHAITGNAPAESQARLLALAQEKPDPYVPLAGRIGDYSSGLLLAIDQAMSISPKDRLHSAQDWQRLIEIAPTPEIIRTGPPKRKWHYIGLTAASFLAISIGGWQYYKYDTAPPAISFAPKAKIAPFASFTYHAPTLSQEQPWEIELPFTLEMNDDNILTITNLAAWAAPQFAGHWLKSGAHLISANSKPLNSMADFYAALLLSQDAPFPSSLHATVLYNTDQSPTPKTGQLQLYSMRAEVFSNGMKLREQFRGKRWQLVVVTPPNDPQTDLKVGDILLAERVLGLSAATLEQLHGVLQKLEQRNVSKGVFSVRRNGELELANLPLKVEIQ